jgi:Zn-dependent protease
MNNNNQPAFTQGARSVLGRANELAQQRNQALITPEHILLGLLKTPRNAALTVLSTMDVNLDRLAQRVETDLGPLQSVSRGPGQLLLDRGGSLSPDARDILNDAVAEARETNQTYVDERLLLLGILRRTGTRACQALVEEGVTLLRARAAWNQGYIAPPEAQPMPSWREVPLTLSPVFLVIIAVTVGAAVLTYMGGAYARIAMFVFVLGGWLISLSLHEFGHALVAFLGGDRSVVQKGYLSLNPFKYTQIMLSIILPIAMLVLGGIGVPGGAVYINVGAIRKRWMRSLMSAAGPFATFLCILILIPPFLLRLVSGSPTHIEFWSGMALLTFLEVTALFFNLLPIPGLDGFGIIEPFLPQSLLVIAQTIRRFTFFIILLLFFNPTPVSDFFFYAISVVLAIFGVHFQLVNLGLGLFRFWEG